MRYERKEYRNLLEKKAKEAAERNKRELLQSAQAVVPMEAMTHSEEWDYFNSLIQAQIEGLDRVVAALQGASLSDPSFDANEMAQHKARILQAETQRATLEQVLLLPAQIIEKGENAKFALHDILGDE